MVSADKQLKEEDSMRKDLKSFDKLSKQINDTVKNIASVLFRRNALMMVAESATGGLVQHFLTEIPGSSNFFLGGIVAYSNELKQSLLQVPEAVINRYGAVSEETVAAMANGVRLCLNADYGLATSGIAGPSGAQPNKPVGLVYIAVSHRGFETITVNHVFTGSRSENKMNFTKAALELFLQALNHHELT